MDYVRPLNTRALFEAAFSLYRKYFGKLLLMNSFFVLVSLIDGLYNLPSSFGDIGSGLLYWVAVVVQMFVTAAICVAVSNAILGRPVKVWASFRRAFSPGYLIELLVLAIPAFLLISVNGPFLQIIQNQFQQFKNGSVSALQIFLSGASLFLVIAGLRVCLEIALLFGPPVAVLEKVGVIGTVKRVSSLFWSNARRVLVNFGLLWLLPLLVLRFVLYFPVAVMLSLIALSRVGLSADNIYQVGLAIGIPTNIIVNGLLNLFFNPMTALLYTLLYYDTRARKENYTQELLAESMGYETMSEMMTV